MDEVCGVWTGFPRPGLCCGGCQYFEIGQLSQMEASKKAFIKKITFPLRHRTVFCVFCFGAAVVYHTNARAEVIAFYREMLVHSYIQNYFTHCCSSVSAISVITSHPSTVSLLFHTTARRAAPDNMQSN